MVWFGRQDYVFRWWYMCKVLVKDWKIKGQISVDFLDFWFQLFFTKCDAVVYHNLRELPFRCLNFKIIRIIYWQKWLHRGSNLFHLLNIGILLNQIFNMQRAPRWLWNEVRVRERCHQRILVWVVNDSTHSVLLVVPVHILIQHFKEFRSCQIRNFISLLKPNHF